MLKISLLIDLSINIAQIVIDYHGVDNNDNNNRNNSYKLIKELSKV